ncbi:MAG: hypothetical protein HFJ17_03320 [Clostridia bacterium]|nr:hypothetical protein [Clostridia bacterium]
MEQENMNTDYNVNNPTEKNIKFVFGNLLFNLVGAINYKPYEEYKSNYEEILKKVQSWIVKYVNTKTLSNIESQEMDAVFDETLILKDKLFMADEWFQEAIHQDIESLRLLRIYQIKKEYSERSDLDGE